MTRQAWAGIERFLLGLYEESEVTLLSEFSSSAWILSGLPEQPCHAQQNGQIWTEPSTPPSFCSILSWKEPPSKTGRVLSANQDCERCEFRCFFLSEELTITLRYGRAGRLVNGIRRSLSPGKNESQHDQHVESLYSIAVI